MEDGCIVRVIKDFLTINEGELCVTKGEYLQVLYTVDRHWVHCKTEHREGIVPTSHVTPQELEDLDENQEIYLAQCNMPGRPDLTVTKGSLIIGLEEARDDWFRGKTLDGELGTFHVSYCWQFDCSNYKKFKVRSRVEKFAQVIHPMTAQLVEEIDLEKGQIVKITEIIDKDWYRGESKGRTGIFPASFVRIVDSFPGPVPPVTADVTMYLNATSNNPSRGNNDYMNTRNAFAGLEENLRALVPTHETSKVVFGSEGAVKKFGRTTSLIEQDDYFKRNLPPSYGDSVFGQSSKKISKGFQELNEGLSVLSEARVEPKVDVPSLDYTNLSKNLSVFESVGEEQSLFNTLLGRHSKKMASGGFDDLNNNGNNVNGDSDFRYQNITCENLGYTGRSVDVRPYGIARYTFVAQFDNELSLSEGDMVYLRRYVDCEWLEGNVDGKYGIFPISYVNIIVDCANLVEPYKSTAVTVHENLKTDTYHKVLYNFQAQIDGDLSVAEGEVVRIKEQHNADWVVVENSFGEVGLCPGNHLDPSADFCGKALFEIERLLSYKALTDKPPSPLRSTAPKPELKFFDPLCSPDDEMLRIEAELQRKAREANSVNVEQKIIEVKNQERSATQPITSIKQQPSKKDLDTLISSNLSKIAAIHTASNNNNANTVNNTKNNTFVPSKQSNHSTNLFRSASCASSVPLTRQQPVNQNGKLDFSQSVLAELRGRQKPPPRPTEPPKLNQTQATPSMQSNAPTLPKSAKPSAPKPLTPLMKRPAPTRPPPPPPPPQAPPGPVEPLYASVNKDTKKEVVRNSTSLPPLPLRPPRPPSPNLIHSPPPPPLESPIHSSSVTVTSDVTNCRDVIVTSADVHAEDYATVKSLSRNSPADKTPTNENIFKMVSGKNDGGDSPVAPARTSSVLKRPALVCKGETFRSYLNLKELDPPASFPPDRQSPGDCNGMPPKVPPSLSVRSASISGSIRSRTAHYTPVASERCFDSPTPSSLHHSYETLNMYDTNDTLGGGGGGAPAKMPHRPAPPVPSAKHNNSDGKHIATQSGEDEIQKFDTIENKKKSRHPMSRRTLRQRKIHSLKRQIQIKEKMLEEQLLRELDMYQEIAVARGPEYDSLNQTMDHCQENIETLSDEIQRLQACLADEEMTLEEDSIEESRRRAEEEQRRALMEVQRREEEKRAREEKIRKNRERRENVISELVVTEREFCRDLKLTWQAFGLDTPAMLEQRGVDVPTLFGNVADVIDISERFLDTLQEEVKSKSNPEEQMVGRCFLQHSETMKAAYTEYCINHDKAEQLLEKYDQIQDIQRMLQKGVETLQSQVACFNMGSILIKPVQRILKYPLILNELIKCTEENHRDRRDLLDAVSIMSDVASFINESKRRKDIIDKYKTEEDKTLTRRISKLNMHSIGKKSSRISQRFLSTIGIDPVNRNLDFDELEKRFSCLIRSVQAFSSDSQRFREQLHECVVSQYNIAETVADLYKDKGHMREVERFRTAHKKVLSTVWNEFNSKLEPRVVNPLGKLIEAFQGPTRLIQKRHDKQLDLQASQQRAEKNRDPNKTRALTDEVEKSRSTFEALNSQLLEELPKLLEVATSIFTDSVAEFVLLRKIFVGKVTKELLSLMDLPLLASTTGDILEVFLVKHSLVCCQLGRFSFSSKTFRPEEKKKGSLSPNGQQLGQKSHDVVPQTSNIRTLLRGKYAAAKLYQANQLYIPSDLLDIGISPGDLVGVVQKKDPMGSDKRWFVDNGLTQGFLPCHVLTAFGETAESQSRPEVVHPRPELNHFRPEMSYSKQEMMNSRPETEQRCRPEPLGAEMPIEEVDETEIDDSRPVVHSYDDVAVDEDESKKQPVRKAPPVPRSSENDEDAITSVDDDKVESSKSEVERMSHHSYEEIAASEANSEPSQDLSPIYEEIHGGSRSSISSTSCSSGGSRSIISSGSSGTHQAASAGNEGQGLQISASGIERGKFYYALYEFTASEPTMINLFRGQVVRVVHLTGGDWCYVEDRHSTKGYVPSSYLKLYMLHQANNSTSNNNNPQPKEEATTTHDNSELPSA